MEYSKIKAKALKEDPTVNAVTDLGIAYHFYKAGGERGEGTGVTIRKDGKLTSTAELASDGKIGKSKRVSFATGGETSKKAAAKKKPTTKKKTK